MSSPGIRDDYADIDPGSPGADPMDDYDTSDRFEIFMPAVQSLVNAVGGYEEIETPAGSGKFETIYRPGDSVLAVLKDLKKLWRKDDTDDERTVARCMAKAGLMKELIALLVECTERGDWGRKVALVACDLIAALTWPIDVAAELKEMADEPDVVTDYASLLRAQVEYKAMIVQTSGPLRCLLALMLPSLAKPRKDEKDQRVISLGLHVVRNLLAIKDLTAEGTAVGEKEEFANLQSTLIVQLNKLTYFQLVLTLASCADKSDLNQYNVLVLDILHLIFRSVKTRDLGQDQARAPMENLTKLLDAEKRHKSLISRTGMTRHSRFGTTVAVRAGEQKIVLHKQNAIADNAGKILDEVKRKRAGKAKKLDELTQIVDLSPEAMRVLQELAKSFIQSCFNTFFTSILKDIRMERSKIRPSDNIRTFYLTRFFIEYLLILRQKEDSNGDQKHELALGLVAEMAEMDSVRFIFSRMRLTMDDKPPAWTELQACLDCFTQVLLLIDAMSTSEDEEDVDIASKLQDQLYYNGDILDSSLSVISQYKDQSVGYLDSVIHFAYVLLRMLEKFSKEKSYMFVRKRKAIRKKKKEPANPSSNASGMPEEYGGEEEDIQVEKEGPSYAEHAFRFQDFEKRFAQEPVTHTLLTYLARFQEFDEPEQMKRVVGLMHRQVVKVQAEGLYYKVSTLNLFRRILDEQQSLPKADTSKDLLQLINFVLRKFFKRVAEDPFLIVEALGPKSRSKWKELSSYKSDEESDDGMGGQQARIKEQMGPAELEFKKSKKLSWSQQMGVVVSILVKEGHESWIQWIIDVLELVLAARTEIVLTIDGQANLDEDSEDEDKRVRNFAGPSKEAVARFVQHDLEPGTEDQRAAVSKDQHFRLMLKLLSFDMTSVIPSQPDDAVGQSASKPPEWKWFIPSTVLPSNLTTSLGAIRQFLLSPPDLDEDPKSLLRKARPARRRRSPSLSDLEIGSDGEIRTRHKEKVQRKKKAVETQVFKSAAFIEDSDDEDEDATKRFFEREAELRAEMDQLARQGQSQMESQGKKRKRDRKGKDKAVIPNPGDGSDEDQDQDQDHVMEEPDSSNVVRSRNDQDASQEEADEATSESDEEPSLSLGARGRARRRAAKRQSLARDVISDVESGTTSPRALSPIPIPPAMDGVDSDEDTQVQAPTVRTYGRARRVVDPDDDD